MTTFPAFCTSCGARLPAGAFCPSCGAAVGVQPSVQPLVQPSLSETTGETAPVAPLEQRWNERSPRGARLAAVAAAIAVAIGAGGAWLVLRPEVPKAARAVAVVAPSVSPSTSPEPSVPGEAPAVADPAARAERRARETASRRAAAKRRRAQLQAAGQVDRLLDASTTARSAVVAATQGLADCVLPAEAAVAGLERVSEMRRRLLDQVDVLDFSPLSHSRQIRSALTQAWSASLDADLSYLAWAQNQDVYGDCDTADGDYLDGNASSARAVAAKKTFASLWNRYVAGPLHLSRRSEAEL